MGQFNPAIFRSVAKNYGAIVPLGELNKVSGQAGPYANGMAAALRGCSMRVIALAFVVLRLIVIGRSVPADAVDGVQAFERLAPSQLEGSLQDDDRANSFFSSATQKADYNRNVTRP
jgi:hypothetical protein